MGRDYDCELSVGFLFAAEELERPFMKVTEETWHTEIRFHERTGVKREVRVVDKEGGERIIFDGTDYTGDTLQFIDVLCEYLTKKCGFPVTSTISGDYYSAEFMFVIGPVYNYDQGTLDPHEVNGQGHFVQQVRLEFELKALGLDPGDFRIRCTMLIS